jgi:phosphoribosylformimino-5-aminoimidazole carboxamide ribotide isomerase
MLIIPAIDLKQGKCVRLRQGNMETATTYSDDPLETADRWVAAGARRLHIVDLDGALEGRPVNAPIIKSIAKKHPDLAIQVGGGIRSRDTVDHYLQAGVNFVIIGTQAVLEPEFIGTLCAEFPHSIIVGLDARADRVATDGWSKVSHHSLVDTAKHFENYGVEAIVYTDIARDGMMQGVNIENTALLAKAISIPVIASGGIHTIVDVRALAEIAKWGVTGAITGRAIYEGTLDLATAQILADELAGAAN